MWLILSPWIEISTKKNFLAQKETLDAFFLNIFNPSHTQKPQRHEAQS